MQQLIKEAIKEHEKKLSEEVRSNKNKVWENIKRLKGEQIKKDVKVQVHKEDGVQLNEEEKRKNIREFWTGIYRKHDNKINEEWSNQERYRYKETLKMEPMKGLTNLFKRYPKELEDHIGTIKKKEEIYFPKILREHMDMEVEVISEEQIDRSEVTKDEVLKVLKGLKKRKAPGPDGLKGELYSAMIKNKTCLETLTRCLNNELQSENKPPQWKISKTVLIAKNRKPTVKDFRPLALTDISYKLFMAILRNRIEEHIEHNNGIVEEQTGFTKGTRLEDNIAIINHLIQDARKTRKKLIITGIDFTKAFDSVKREKIIETLKHYKLDERIIGAISSIYTEDVVELHMEEGFKESIVATSGIRQGCTLSATLFKLITYRIITEINKETRGYRTPDRELKALFFADDGLIINEDVEQASHSIRTLQKVARNYGLEINKQKSNILTFNIKDEPDEIEGIKTSRKMKYLGIWIEDKRDIFKTHKEEKLKLAQRLSNTTHSIINRSCNRMLIGKTFWKNVAIPAILYGSGVIAWNQKEIQQLQTIQNAVCRKILNAPKYATISSMRGEIGISMMKSRLVQGRIGYITNRMSQGNSLIKSVINKLVNGGAYEKIVKQQSEELQIDKEELIRLQKGELKKKVYAWDTEKWRQELEKKKTMLIYKEYKKEIKEEEYENDLESTLWFKARANCLKLEDKNRQTSKECKLCGTEIEDLEHFILKCNRLEKIRTEDIRLQKPHNEHTHEIIGEFLFTKEDITRKKSTIKKLWLRREAIIKAEQAPADGR